MRRGGGVFMLVTILIAAGFLAFGVYVAAAGGSGGGRGGGAGGGADSDGGGEVGPGSLTSDNKYYVKFWGSGSV